MYLGSMQLIKPRQISGEIMTLIEEADKKVILVSPYFKVKNWHKLLNIFNDLIKRRIDVEMFVREGEHESIREAREAGFKPITIPHLHTKLYMNEKVGIVSSMNLLYSSDTSSLDIALKTENSKEYGELWEYFTRYISKIQAEPLSSITNYDWRNDLMGRLTKSFGNKANVEEQAFKLIIQTGNRYETVIKKNVASELRINGILSGKEFEYLKRHPNKIAPKGMRIEYSEGGNGYYDTVWGICGNLKSIKISDPLPNEAKTIVDMIIGFIENVEQLKKSLK